MTEGVRNMRRCVGHKGTQSISELGASWAVCAAECDVEALCDRLELSARWLGDRKTAVDLLWKDSRLTSCWKCVETLRATLHEGPQEPPVIFAAPQERTTRSDAGRQRAFVNNGA